jgi:hypothetical protein
VHRDSRRVPGLCLATELAVSRELEQSRIAHSCACVNKLCELAA